MMPARLAITTILMMVPPHRVARLSAAIPLLCLLVSCASFTPEGEMERSPLAKTVLSWPLASAKERIIWIKSISLKDTGSGGWIWRNLLHMVSGSGDTAMVRPYGILRSGNVLYLADPGGGVVHRFDFKKGSLPAIGQQKGVTLRSPIGLTEDNMGRIYITDSVAGTVFRLDPQDGSIHPFLNSAIDRPTGIVFHPPTNMLYISDSKAGVLFVVDLNGVVKRKIVNSKNGTSLFNRPTDLAVDARGQIYVSDPLNYRIMVLTPEGEPVQQFGAAGDTQGFFSRPKGVAVDSIGNIYVVDALIDAVQLFDRTGVLQLLFGRNGSGPGQFWAPSGLFIDHDDQIYVADTYNRRVQIFRLLPNRGDEDALDDADLFDKQLP